VGLYDVDTDELIVTLEDGIEINESLIVGRNLTIAAFVSDDSPIAGDIGSVSLNFNDGDVVQTENVEPYALFGDRRGDFFEGDLFSLPADNTIELTAFAQRNLGGDELGSESIDFTVNDDIIGTPVVTVGLFDTDTDTLIETIEAGDVIAVNPDQNLTLVAIVPDDSVLFGRVESVFLNLNSGERTQTENTEPYALFGDRRGDFNEGLLSLGSNTVQLDLYSQNRLGGALLETVSLDFSLVETML
ncbi:MAG: hypothetical protein F6K30_17715, partial [Cyanothece sp. SIO2G6]|nr:hypothetical protein [Cyanothece sp. SIO2G6]